MCVLGLEYACRALQNPCPYFIILASYTPTQVILSAILVDGKVLCVCSAMAL